MGGTLKSATPQANMLAWRTIDWIEDNPQQHQQADWRCRTGMCFAGALVTEVRGLEWATDDPGLADFAWVIVDEDGTIDHVGDVATTLLIDPTAPTMLEDRGVVENVLFGPTCTLPQLKKLVQEFFGPRETP